MSRLLDSLIRLTGTDPGRVRALARGLHREARGQLAWRHAEEGGRGLSPDAGRILVLVLLGLASIAVAVGMAGLAARPLLATMLLVAVQGGAVFLRSAGEVVPLVLGAEDRAVLGWWPLTERELLVARGVVLMGGVLEATAAIAAIPLVVLAVTGSPLLVPCLGSVAALSLHAITLAAVMLLLVQGLGRLLGRRRARRLVELLGTMVMIILANVMVRSAGRYLERLDELPRWWLMLLPTTWYGSWGAIGRPTVDVFLGLGLSLAATGLLLAVGVRALGGLGLGDREPPARSRRRGPDWTKPLVALAAPWLRGRDGQAMRLLLRAHLREDWRFTGSLLLMPAALLVYLFASRLERLGDLAADLAGVGRAATMLSLWMSMLGLSLGAAVTCSTEAAAGWLLNGAVVAPDRLLSLQRRVVRALVPVPLLVVATAGLVWRTALTPAMAPLAMAPAWLAFEIMVTFVQWIMPAAPFSRAWRREGHGYRHLYLLLIVLWPVIMAPLIVFYGRSALGPPLTLLLQIAVLAALRLALRGRAHRIGVFGFAPRPR